MSKAAKKVVRASGGGGKGCRKGADRAAGGGGKRSATGRKAAVGKGVKKKPRARRRRSAAKVAAEVRLLGMECEGLVAAAAAFSGPGDLADLISKRSPLGNAWRRGRLLRELRGLAKTAATVPEAAEAMRIPPADLAELLKTDAEVGDIWRATRLGVVIDLKTALVGKAKQGHGPSLKRIEAVFSQETPRGCDLQRLGQAEMVELVGKTRQTLHTWETKCGLPRNGDGTYDVAAFIAWLEGYVAAQAGKGPARSTAASDPLRAAKAATAEMDLEQRRGRLLDRDEVIAGLLARQQALANALDGLAATLAVAIANSPATLVEQRLASAFVEIRGQQCQVPEELRLPPAAEATLVKLLEGLRGDGDG